MRLARKARLRFDRHTGRYVLMGPERGLVLNDSAAAIVRLCDGRSIEVIVAELGAETESDVRRFVDDLLARRILVGT